MNMPRFGKHTLGVALFAGAATLAIAIVGAIASYIDNYYTTSAGQWDANDLRLRIYEHLHRLSLRYYDNAEDRRIEVSTITSDVATIRDFAPSSTLDIVIDLLTIVFMVGLMRGWIGILPSSPSHRARSPDFHLLRISEGDQGSDSRGTQAAKRRAVHRSARTGFDRVTKAFGRQNIEVAHLEAASRATVAASLRARKKSIRVMSPVVNIVVAICTAIVLWKGTSLIVAGAMTAGALTVYLAYLKKFFKPVKDLASMTSTVAQTTVALERDQAIL